jgi:AraC-like DNA-binding protein/ligand-binding sensor protein
MQSTLSAVTAETEARPTSAPAERNLAPQILQSSVYREYRKAFETTTGLPLTFRAVGSFKSPLQDSKRLNPFCALMAARNKTCSACLQLQQRVEEQAQQEATTLQCFAGLSESAVPVRVGDQVLGFLQTGQVLLQAPSKTQFGKTVRQLSEWNSELDIPELETAYFKTRVVKKSNYDSVIRLLSIFAQHLSSISNQIAVQENSAESPAMTKARQFIQEHRIEQISLAQVAKAVNMSPFYFCKLFKKATGLTFTDYVSRVRIEAVKQLFLNPHTRVSEAAFEAGFQSLSQFNRVFRRIAGESPTVYRDRLHGASHN